MPEAASSPSPARPRWIGVAIRYRHLMLLAAIVVGVAGWGLGRDLHLDRSIENMFAPDDPILVPYHRLQRTFGRHEVVLAMYADDQLVTQSGVERIRALTQALRKINGVVAVVALTDLPGAADFADDDVGRRFRDMFSSYTHNTQLDAAGAICLIRRPGPGDPPRRQTLAAMRQLIHKYPSGALVGEPVLVEEAFDLLEQDGQRLATWCTVLVLAVILACFRSVRWLLLPLAVVQLTLAATRGAIVLSGLQLSMVSSMLSAIVTVVGVAAVVHVIVRYQEARRNGLAPLEALASTLDQLAGPVAFACLTDAAGFAALMVSDVGPVDDFGLMTGLGSLLVLPACLMLSPSLTLFADSPPPPSEQSAASGPLSRLLAGLLHWSQHHAVAVGVAGTLLTIAAIAGSQRLEVETAFTKNFRADSRIVQQYEFVETRFGGAGVWELLIPAPLPKKIKLRTDDNGQAILPAPTIDQMVDVLQTQRRMVESIPLLSKAISIADSFRAALGRLMANRMAVATAWLGMQRTMPQFMDTMYNVDPATGQPWIHVLLRSPEELGAQEKTDLIQNARRIAAKKFPEAEVTGYYVLLAYLIDSLLADQWLTFGVSVGIVTAMMAVAFRSIPLSVVTMIPNVVPVLVLFGAMGWLGLKINMGAAMIAAVSVGLSVDGSIHYVMLYQRLRRLGVSLNEALRTAQNSVGRAATYATLALVVGFATLVVSEFIPTIYFGALVSLAMIGGLIGNLLILPGLIAAVDRRAYAPA
ncbi:MAG: MMPL family transporter [Pirellulales bacterium]|nr:MMPL family transporter [Pirellulales bacterium]